MYLRIFMRKSVGNSWTTRTALMHRLPIDTPLRRTPRGHVSLTSASIVTNLFAEDTRSVQISIQELKKSTNTSSRSPVTSVCAHLIIVLLIIDRILATYRLLRLHQDQS